MKYVILDWANNTFCWVSIRIPDTELPGGLICRSINQIREGALDLAVEWKYEPDFKRHEADYLLKNQED